MKAQCRTECRCWGVTVLLAALVVFAGGPRQAAAVSFAVTNLTSDGSVPALHIDPNLKNPWGIAYGPTSPMWVSDNATGLTTLYNGNGVPQALVVTIPGAGGGMGTPTGQVFNANSGDFGGARFIFASEDGLIASWSPANGTQAIIKVDNSGVAGAVYKGLAIGASGAGPALYAADFRGAVISAFDSTFAPAALGGSFTDPVLPAGYAPFNVQQLQGSIFVAYALKDAGGIDEVAGPGNGFVSVFDANGNFLRRLVSGGALNAPWGMAIAPASFGEFAGSLLVGNFGDGKINAYDPLTGTQLGTLKDAIGNDIVLDGLWALTPGNGGVGSDPMSIYFTAGPNDETGGLFGRISTIPEPVFLPALGLACGAAAVWRRIRGRGATKG